MKTGDTVQVYGKSAVVVGFRQLFDEQGKLSSLAVVVNLAGTVTTVLPEEIA